MKSPRHKVDRSIHDDFIVNHYRKGVMSTKDIAEHLGIPRGSVMSRYYIAKGIRVGNKYFPTGEGHWRSKYK